MTNGNIDFKQLFGSLQAELDAKLKSGRIIQHPGSKGDNSELNWIEMLRQYLPQRYRIEKAFVVDSKGAISEQLDIVVFDAHYSPPIFNTGGTLYVPAESVYAVLEVKPELNKENLEYASQKAASARKLHRTSVEIRHAGGVYPAKQ